MTDFSSRPMPATAIVLPPPLLKIKGLHVCFEKEKPVEVVRGLSFTVHAGKTMCLVGESGCGKSMTALAILRLVPAPGKITAGSIQLSGEEILQGSTLQRVRGRHIGMIFQEPMTALNPVLRIGDQVAEGLQRHFSLSRRSALEKAEEALRQVGIQAPASRLKDYPHQLSGGMRQRVMIAMSLVCKPDLLIADEPTTALDVTIQGQILDLLKELALQRGMGLVLITHDLGVVAEIADEVCVMYAGKIVEQATVQELFSHPLHPYTLGLMRSAPTLDHLLPSSKNGAKRKRLDVIPGSVPQPGLLPEGCPFRPRCSEATHSCHVEPPETWIQADSSRAEISGAVVYDSKQHLVRCWHYIHSHHQTHNLDNENNNG